MPERGALPVANLLYLGLAYAGGLWMPARDLPAPVRSGVPAPPDPVAVGPAGRDGAGLTRFAWVAVVALVGFSGLFALLAVAGYRRDEGRRFR